MSIDTSIDFLEQLFLNEEEGDDNVHEECPFNNEHVICGAKDPGNKAPEWVEINCETCNEMYYLTAYRPVLCKICHLDIT